MEYEADQIKLKKKHIKKELAKVEEEEKEADEKLRNAEEGKTKRNP